MKHFNILNALRYEADLKAILSDKKYETNDISSLTRDELIIKFTPLVINLARKFSTAQESIGILTISDLISAGNEGLILACDRVDEDKLLASEHPMKTLKAFLSKRIVGAIRRSIDKSRSGMKIPEYKINEIRKSDGTDDLLIATFFRSIFKSTDAHPVSETMPALQVEDTTSEWNPELLSSFLRSLLKKYLNLKEAIVLQMAFGIGVDGKKYSAKEIAEHLNLKGERAYVQVSQLKKQAINRLIHEVDYETIIPFLQQ